MWNTFLATELAKRGHQVTYIASLPLKEKPHPNMNASIFQSVTGLWEQLILDSYTGPVTKILHTLETACKVDCELMFEKEPYKNLIHPSNKDTYDVIIMEFCGHDCLLALAHRFKAPIIVANPLTYNPHWLYRLMGVPLFHLAPHSAHSLTPPYDIWKRLEALWVYLSNDWDYYTRIRPAMERSIKKYFGEDTPSLKELTESIGFALVNVPDWMNKIPLPGNVLPIGGIHLTEAKPLSPVSTLEYVITAFLTTAFKKFTAFE